MSFVVTHRMLFPFYSHVDMAYSGDPPVHPPRPVIHPTVHPPCGQFLPFASVAGLKTIVQPDPTAALCNSRYSASEEIPSDLFSHPHRDYFSINFSALSFQAYLNLLQPPHLLNPFIAIIYSIYIFI